MIALSIALVVSVVAVCLTWRERALRCDLNAIEVRRAIELREQRRHDEIKAQAVTAADVASRLDEAFSLVERVATRVDRLEAQNASHVLTGRVRK